MARDVIHVGPDTPLTRVLEIMVANRTRSLPVLDAHGAVLGVISRQDLIRALDDATQGEAAAPSETASKEQ
jgi:CBS domain-containing protein